MIRKYFANLKESKKDKINWRSHDVTRIEAFSDAVFAFAVSLLVISLEVPKTSKELIESLKGLIPFIFCFGIIFWIWRSQYRFFRRFGLHDRYTLTLNGMLLFITLAFVYPLKFLFSALFLPEVFSTRAQDYASLTMLYNGGFAVIGFLFSLMYLNAHWKRDEIKLTPVEDFETVNLTWGHAIPALASCLAVFITYMLRNGDPNNVTICYSAYALLGIAFPLFDRIRNKSFKKRFGNAPMTEPHHGTEG